MKRIINKIRYVSLKDIFSPFIFILILPFSIFYRMILNLKHEQLWLICEDGITARDNGYHLFNYIMKNHPECKCYYVIKKTSKDYKKISKYSKNIVSFSSLKHWLFYMSATWNISIHKHGNPSQAFFYFIHVILKLYDNRIFLQHGVIKDDLPFVHYKNARFRIFICSAEREYEFVKDNFGYPEGRVQNTGLARFDNLHDYCSNKKQILFMPTWRNWFGGHTKFENNNELFKETPFFKYWNGLMNNLDLIDFIEKNEITIYFYPHQHMQKFLKFFSSQTKNIKIIDNSSIDIQCLLKESSLLITDYSSVFMDFGYMLKPVVYYQFDETEFRKNHLPKGYFDYRKDGFGEVLVEEEQIVNKIINLITNDYIDDNVYYDRANKFFGIRDKNNCERIYNLIKELKK